MYKFDKSDIELVDYRKLNMLINDEGNGIPFFIKGQRYSLRGTACDGFEMKSKTYELVGIVDEYGGVPIESVIMKQVEGSQDLIFTLSKHDCECLGIEYEQGLQLWPKQMKWEMVKDEVEFDEDDLSTLPLSPVDNTIRYAVIRIKGFNHHDADHYKTPNEQILKRTEFRKRLSLTLRRPLVYEGRYAMSKGCTFLSWNIITPSTICYPYGDSISAKGYIYILLTFKRRRTTLETLDGMIGIEPAMLEGLRITDLFKFTLDDEGLYTEEEIMKKLEREQRDRERQAQRQLEMERIRDNALRQVAIARQKGIVTWKPPYPQGDDFNNYLNKLYSLTENIERYVNIYRSIKL